MTEHPFPVAEPRSITPNLATVKPEHVRVAVRSWLEQNWDPDLCLLDWRRRLVGSGWAVPSWPPHWGGQNLPIWADDIARAEFDAAGAVYLPVGVGPALAAPTILAHGPDPLRRRFLVPTLAGEETWCQLFSEPGAGSDLAGVTTRAELDGDEWVVSGQKVWNTSAHHADLGLLLARTEWDAPKHHGLTYFVVPMHQPGVEVRPLRQMNHRASFNEVFLTAARIPQDWVVGAVGQGWQVALTTLAFERHFGSLKRPGYPQSNGRAVGEARREAESFFSTYEWYPQRAGRVDLVVDRARVTGASSNPIVRQEIARAWSMFKASGWTAERARAASDARGRPGPEGSIGKLSLSMVARQAANVHSLICGAHGMLSGADGPLDGVISEILVSVPAQSIAGGTDEIQRNIVAETALGLPREPVTGRDVPFRKLLRNG